MRTFHDSDPASIPIIALSAVVFIRWGDAGIFCGLPFQTRRLAVGGYDLAGDGGDQFTPDQ